MTSQDTSPAANAELVRAGFQAFNRIAGGLIAEEWICSDTATLLRHIS